MIYVKLRCMQFYISTVSLLYSYLANYHKVIDSNFANLNFAACNVDQFHTKLEGALYIYIYSAPSNFV